ncbi:nucleotide exchange factor GrpE [Beduini massiliensis]|uniref:nucleotide exchange factor GrpE n=1 Tax=Beduini massiliensis TaxID=1585974 RepID=UPI00059A8765|nr:nucleotide exchange factor GrpE [Beduini massiliensis]
MEKDKVEQEVNEEVEENQAQEQEENVEEVKTEKSVEELQQEKIAELGEEVEKWKTDYYKVFADMENLKKRLQNEHANALKYMLQSFAEDLLPVVDNLERSQNVAEPSEELKNFLKGYEMITAQFIEALKKHGIEQIDVEGKEFDPNFHQAVMMVNDDNYGHNMIVEELQKGYKLKDRVIRASLVKVNE